MQRGRAIPERTTIALFRFVACVFFVLLFLIGCSPARNQTLEQTIEQTYAIDPTASISISNRDGSIRIYGSNAGEMRLQAIKKAYTSKRLNGIAVNVLAQPNAISIETKYPPEKRWGFSDRFGTVDYTIVVPQTATISRLELANGEVLIEGLRGRSVQARLGSGLLFDRNCFTDLDLAVRTGNLDLIYEWWEQRKFSVHATIEDGNGWAFIPSDATFHLLAETRHGKIANDFTEKEERRAEATTKIDTLVGDGNDVTINMQTSDGNIKITEANP